MTRKGRRTGVKKAKQSIKTAIVVAKQPIPVESVKTEGEIVTKKIKKKSREFDIIKQYYSLVMNVETLIKIRTRILLQKCPSLVFRTRNTLDDRIERYLSLTNTVKRASLSQTTLASTLLISKTQYSRVIEKYFEKFDLNRNILQPSVRVMIKYEKLRLLVMEYYREKRRDDAY
ncbi:hypothetical protein CDIK_0519 [Cucumispora dikerogammari]|nr:hypothetical protein CDIK_0519 [Cucumispora dikerogammari]